MDVNRKCSKPHRLTHAPLDFGCRIKTSAFSRFRRTGRLPSAISFPFKRGETMGSVKQIPEGYHNVTPYLFVRSAASAIDFYKSVFGATEIMRMPGSNGKIMHAEMRIGDSIGKLADDHPRTALSSLK